MKSARTIAYLTPLAPSPSPPYNAWVFLRFRVLALPLFCLFLLGGCLRLQKPEEWPMPRNARNATVYVTIVTRALTALPRTARQSAPLGIHLGTYFNKGEILVHGARESISLLSPLVRTSDTSETPFMTIQTIGNLLQTNIVDAMNKNTERGEVLNHYIILLRSALQIAQKDKENLEDSRRKLVEKERDQRSALRTLQKEIDAAEKAGDFQVMGSRQRTLSETKGEQGKTEALVEEQEDTLDILDDLMHLAEERLHAIEENREALMTGIRVVEIPGIEKLGILEKRESPRRRKMRQEQKGGFLDFSDI